MNQDDVFRFDVSVDDVMRVQMTNCWEQPPHQEGHRFLLQSWLSLEQIEQLPIDAQLHEEVHIVGVTEDRVYLQNMAVADVGLDLQLTDQDVL